ncbi:MAG: helix-turn-helix transcriptional regulator [Gammaproteobacteria bacterium]
MTEYLTQAEAANFTRLSPRTLERMRLTGTGPRYSKAGRRVIYSRRAIEEWLEKRTYKSTSDAAA